MPKSQSTSTEWQCPDNFWTIPADEILKTLDTSSTGLSSEDAAHRLDVIGPNQLKKKSEAGFFKTFLAQFKNPVVLLLLFSSILSIFLGEAIDSTVIIILVVLSALLSLYQERKASNAVAELLAMVEITTQVFRDGQLQKIPAEGLVPGDIVYLTAGKAIPADCLLIQSTDLYVRESTLTGETFPVEKATGVLDEETPLAKRTNVAYMGTSVVTGSAMAAVVKTAKQTEFGKVYERLRSKPQETTFEAGIRKFGLFLVEFTFILVVIIFVVNIITKLWTPIQAHVAIDIAVFEQVLSDSFMFSLALAVGLTPELLPAVVTATLSIGARQMAKDKVIVKKLNSIENFGSIDVLCSDKTGTLTEGVAELYATIDLNDERESNDCKEVHLYAYLNAVLQSGFENPVDEAIKQFETLDISAFTKKDEVAYDFVRKRQTVLVEKDGQSILITKGAVPNVLSICSMIEHHHDELVPIDHVSNDVRQLYEKYANEGYRLLAVAYKNMRGVEEITKADETDMILAGFIILSDPPKPGVPETIKRLQTLGVELKIITGDSKLTARSIGKDLGISSPIAISGPELRETIDEALVGQMDDIDIFAEVEPNQKERVINAVKKAGYSVGYIGDGINDVSALHAADVGISVNSAVDVAKEAADIVLLEKDLGVVATGITEGRKTFFNTMKYIFITISANFGNMVTFALASFMLPFLKPEFNFPMLPLQILIINLLTDIPMMYVALDNVDPEQLTKPEKWDITFIKRFMVFFGLISTIFDWVTFFVLLNIPGISEEEFHTGWFIESILTELLVLLVLRTRRSVFKSKPAKEISWVTAIIGIATIAITIIPTDFLGFAIMNWYTYVIICGITVAYALTTELGKYYFYRPYRKVTEALLSAEVSET
ncbi:MAG TPA: magnesium-translocating P-type ATPase [Candidatus Lokiarchaeia archaeon]|nr:magnesium-translocating P-type ATPase [Candidatus Lokiarchaeia archaeon]